VRFERKTGHRPISKTVRYRTKVTTPCLNK